MILLYFNRLGQLKNMGTAFLPLSLSCLMLNQRAGDSKSYPALEGDSCSWKLSSTSILFCKSLHITQSKARKRADLLR